MSSKVKQLAEAISQIPDNAHIATVSFGVGGTPEYLLLGLHEYFKAHQSPRDISFSTTAGIGTIPGETGADLLALDGFLKRFYGSHIMSSPKTSQAILDDKIEGYLIPQGTVGMLYHDAARHSSGVLTQVGLNTYADPDQSGSKMNTVETDEIVEKIQLNNEEWLYYKPWKIDVALIKATFADERGNLSFRHETNELEIFSLAAAAHNNGGIVIAQVEQVVEAGSLPAREVKIPSALVDYVVVADPKYHVQTFNTPYDPALAQQIKVRYEDHADFKISPKKVIARRAELEIQDGMIVNIGYGLASETAKIFAEKGRVDDVYLTTDLGAFGGLPSSGYRYGTNYNAEAIINSLDMFALYHGGGLDACILGFGQFNEVGDMNATELAGRLIGPGGMLDITHGAKNIIFIGTFTTKAELSIESGKLNIIKEGKPFKFVKDLSYVTFNAGQAIDQGKTITIITERAVFTVSENRKLCLIEYAPGIDVEEDILKQIPFDVEVSDDLKEMSADLFFE